MTKTGRRRLVFRQGPPVKSSFQTLQTRAPHTTRGPRRARPRRPSSAPGRHPSKTRRQLPPISPSLARQRRRRRTPPVGVRPARRAALVGGHGRSALRPPPRSLSYLGHSHQQGKHEDQQGAQHRVCERGWEEKNYEKGECVLVSLPSKQKETRTQKRQARTQHLHQKGGSGVVPLMRRWRGGADQSCFCDRLMIEGVAWRCHPASTLLPPFSHSVVVARVVVRRRGLRLQQLAGGGGLGVQGAGEK